MADPTYVTNGYSVCFAAGGHLFHSFQADTLPHAQTVAQTLATMFQRAVKLSSVGTGTATVYEPEAQGASVTIPTGVSS